MSNLWQRLMARMRTAQVRRVEDEEQMSPAERRAVEQPIEDRASDEVAAERLGGFDPSELEEP
jgi:hypothetical protein